MYTRINMQLMILMRWDVWDANEKKKVRCQGFACFLHKLVAQELSLLPFRSAFPSYFFSLSKCISRAGCKVESSRSKVSRNECEVDVWVKDGRKCLAALVQSSTAFIAWISCRDVWCMNRMLLNFIRQTLRHLARNLFGATKRGHRI